MIILAITAVVASFVISCSGGISEADTLDLSKEPLQRIINMFAVQTDTGDMKMRMEARVMEHYEQDTVSYDSFPLGISVYSYNEEGLLEAVIVSDKAMHITPKAQSSNNEEIWQAFGNVILHNVLKQETMETDTIYWNQTEKEIYTDCYVKMYSPDYFMQGVGMRSDEQLRNSRLNNPFNGNVLVVKDTTAVMIDSVNFIGPFKKK